MANGTRLSRATSFLWRRELSINLRTLQSAIGVSAADSNQNATVPAILPRSAHPISDHVCSALSEIYSPFAITIVWVNELYGAGRSANLLVSLRANSSAKN